MTDAFPNAGNPFSTRHVRPGAIDYIFPPGLSGEQLLSRLAACDWTGQIVGPHGSGKSTLLASLQKALRVAARQTHLISLHDGQRRMPRDAWPADEPPGENTVVLVDGFEQLSPLSRARLKRFCRRAHCGLVVTCHDSVGLPALVQTGGDPEIVGRLVRQLLTRHAMHVDDEQLQQLLDQHGDNVRELLFTLYDRFEQQRTA